MTKLTTAILFSIVTSCGRADRLCDARVDGICINTGNALATVDDVGRMIDILYNRYTTKYCVEFVTREIADDLDLYVVFLDDTEARDICDGVQACYVYAVDEIYVSDHLVDGTDELTARYKELWMLAHEMMHVWNRNVLRHKRPDLFRPNFYASDLTHNTPGMWGGEGSVQNTMKLDLLLYVVNTYDGDT